jgi:hypothetical protein
MTNNEHVERLESLAAELDTAMAFLDPPTPGETYWQELDAVSLRAGAAALRKRPDEGKLSAYAFRNYGSDATLYNGVKDIEDGLAEALRGIKGAKLALEHAMRIFANNGLTSKGIDRIAAALAELEGK